MINLHSFNSNLLLDRNDIMTVVLFLFVAELLSMTNM